MAKQSKAPKGYAPISIPKGYSELLGGDVADIWKPRTRGEFIAGEVISDKVVETKQGRKKLSSRLLTLRDIDGIVQSVWVSAALKRVFDEYKTVKGRNFLIAFQGLKKIKGQGNPMKDFRVFERNSNVRSKGRALATKDVSSNGGKKKRSR